MHFDRGCPARQTAPSTSGALPESPLGSRALRRERMDFEWAGSHGCTPARLRRAPEATAAGSVRGVGSHNLDLNMMNPNARQSEMLIVGKFILNMRCTRKFPASQGCTTQRSRLPELAMELCQIMRCACLQDRHTDNRDSHDAQ